MGKSLGIDVKIKLPSMTNLTKELNDKWKGVKNSTTLKVNVQADKNSLGRMKSQIQSTLDSKAYGIKLKVDMKHANKQMSEFRKDYLKIKSDLERGIDVKLNYKKDAGSKGLQKTVESNTKQLGDVTRGNSKYVQQMAKEVGRLDKNFDNSMRKTVLMANGTMQQMEKVTKKINSFQEEVTQFSGSDEMSIQNKITNRKDALKQVMGVMKDINGLEAKSVGASDKQIAANKKLISSHKEYLATLKSDYKDTYGKNVEDDSVYKRAKAVQQHNLDMKAASQALAQQKQEAAQLKEQLAGVVRLENERTKLLTKSDTKGESEAQVMREKANSIKDKIRGMEEEHKFAEKLSDSQRKSLQNIRQANSEQRKYAASVREASSRDKEYASKTDSLYKNAEKSISRIAQLKKSMHTAGGSEKSELQQTVALEERKLKAIESQARARKGNNSQRHEEYKQNKKIAYEKAEQDGRINAARQRDSTRNSNQGGIRTVMNIDPIRVAQTAKRAFMTVYDSVAQVDEQLVNIQKVANVPTETLDKFNEGLYQQAALVGKSADAYAESVARWITTGKTLEESTQLAQTSVMGSFVGNINEEDMVNYMSVPLNAYKDSALEATDVINAMNEVSNNNAIEMDDLGKAYSRAAATASTAGTSFAELTGMITAGQEATRAGGEKIGTALRAVDINFGKIASGSTKGDQEKLAWFEEMGIKIKDENGNLESTYDIMGNIAEKWEGMTKEQQTLATTYAGGKNHSAVLQGIIKNFETARKAAQEAQEQVNLVNKEGGSAFEEFEKQQDSVQFKMNELKTTWQEFLHTISGGRSGVNAVLETLNGGLKKATELAKNEKLMNFGKRLAKVGGAMVGMSAIGKVFGYVSRFAGLSGGISKSVSAFKTLSGIFKGGGILKGVSGISKIGSAFRVAGTLASNFLLPLKLIMLALMGLELLGVDVFGSLGKVVEHFASPLKKAQNRTKELKKEQEGLNKTVQEGLKVIKEYKKVKESRANFDKIVKGKKKEIQQQQQQAEQNGTPKPSGKIMFSKDEFGKIQKDFAERAEALGVDIKLEMNDYEEIKSKFDELEKRAKKLSGEKAIEIEDAIDKSGKNYKKIGTVKDEKRGWWDNFKLENKMENKNNLIGHEMATGKDLDKVRKYYAELAQLRADYYQTMGSKSKLYDEKDKQVQEVQKSVLKSRAGLFDAAENGNLGNRAGEKGAKLLATEIPQLEKKRKILEGINKKVEAAGKIQQENEQNGTNKEFSGKFNKEEQAFLDTLGNGQFKGMSTDLNAYKENLSELQGVLKETSKASEETYKNVENSVRSSLEGKMNKSNIDNLIKNMKSDKTAFIQELASWGDGIGESVLGISSRFMEGTKGKWSEALISMQQEIGKMETSNPEGYEMAVKLKLITDEGFANTDELAKVYDIPEEITTKLGLVVEETGAINIEKVTEVMTKLQSIPSEIKTRLDVDENGFVTLDEFADKFKELDILSQKELLVHLGMNNEEVDAILEELTGRPIEPEVTPKVKEGAKEEIEKQAEGAEPKVKPKVAEGTKEEIEKQAEGAEPKVKPKVAEGTKEEIEKQAEGAEPKVKPKVAEGTKEEIEKQADGAEPKVKPKVDGDTKGEIEKQASGAQPKVDPKVGGDVKGEIEKQASGAKVNIKPEFSPMALAGGINGGVAGLNPIKVPVQLDTASAISQANSAIQGGLNEIKATVNIDAGAAIAAANATIQGGLKEGKVTVNADTSAAEAGLSKVGSLADGLNGKSPKITISDNASSAIASISGVTAAVAAVPSSKTITFTAAMSGNLSSLLAKAGSVQTITFAGKKKSIASIGEGIGKSMSKSVSGAIGIGMAAGQKGKGGHKSMSKGTKPAKVNEDVWRYWSKELFKGLPLETSMDELKNAITDAKDNHDELIKIYKKQIAQIDKQIKYEQSIKGAKQSEMNAVLSKLRKEGFRTSGNQITNLGHAKNIKGDDRVSDVNENLSKYKELYSSINDLNKTITGLKRDQKQAKLDIEEAKKAKELKAIEARNKKSDALLRAIKNNSDIMSRKLDLIGSDDFELGLTFNEEAANRASTSVSKLADEFNNLSKSRVENSENAEKIKSQLESVKSEILSNADALIKYKQAINDIKLSRLNNDVKGFSDIMKDNTSKIGDNIENIKDGLLSGTQFKDLFSSSLSTLDLSRKTQLERQYQERLNLESKLNEALEAFDKKNIERKGKVANATLQIEKKKYAQLLKMQSEFSNGKVGNVSSIDVATNLGKTTPEKHTGFTKWTKELEKYNNEYVKVYDKISATYDKKMKNASTQVERDALTHAFIIEQLKLQEKMYKNIISANKQGIDKAKAMLKDGNLTTDQIHSIKDAIKDYESEMIDSQEKIKDSVKSRYDLEFDLIDKLEKSAESYTKQLEFLLDIQEAVGTDESVRGKLLESIYEGKVNQYATARDALNGLLKAQGKVKEGSYEWNLLQDKIEDVRDSMNDLTIDVLEANKKLLESRIDGIQEDSEKGIMGGKNKKEWESYQDKWLDGIKKELELERIRKKAMDLESDIFDKKLEMLDRQEAVSKKDLDYIDKQLDVLELQEKLNNLNNERTIQTLVRNDDGTWDWDYVVDQSEIDKTKEELNKAQKELEEFKDGVRKDYVNDLGDIMGDAKDGKFKTPEELRAALQELEDVYGSILDDIPDVELANIDDIIKIYEDYLKNNKDIISNVTDGKDNKDYAELMDGIGERFEKSFRNIAEDLGELIAESMSKTIGNIEGSGLIGGNYTIQSQTLSFPNVTNTDGFEEVLLDLPSIAKQDLYKKR